MHKSPTTVNMVNLKSTIIGKSATDAFISEQFKNFLPKSISTTP